MNDGCSGAFEGDAIMYSHISIKFVGYQQDLDLIGVGGFLDKVELHSPRSSPAKFGMLFIGSFLILGF